MTEKELFYSVGFVKYEKNCMCVIFLGCPGAKKNEFLTSILDALSTDMVHAVSDPSSSGRYVTSTWSKDLRISPSNLRAGSRCSR